METHQDKQPDFITLNKSCDKIAMQPLAFVSKWATLFAKAVINIYTKNSYLDITIRFLLKKILKIPFFKKKIKKIVGFAFPM